MLRVCHLSTAHRSDDPRIVLKEGASLAAAGFDTHFVVPTPHAASESGVHLHSPGPRRKTRAGRMLATTLDVLRAARRIDADVYHFHDPELIPVGLALTAAGKRVVYDVHEDVASDILTKEWILPPLRRPVSRGYEIAANVAARSFAAVVTATPHIGELLRPAARKLVVINNYPFLAEFAPATDGGVARERAVVYAGAVAEIRGILQLLEAVALADVKLILAGWFDGEPLHARARAHRGWKNTEFLGRVSRAHVQHAMWRARIGVLPFHPIPNHIYAQPNKMFEYMSAGLPVVSSNFELWESVLRRPGREAGLCVDPLDPHAMAAAISELIADPQRAEEMGAHGRRLIETEFNWEAESVKIVDLYRSLS